MYTGRIDFSVSYLAPTIILGLIFCLPDALDAEGTLLHDPLRAHGDIRVELPIERLGEGVEWLALFGMIEPVEVPDLVRTVVGAVARAHAPIVDLSVQTIRRVVRREHRTNRLARRVGALLTRHGNDARLEGLPVFPSLEISLDPYP